MYKTSLIAIIVLAVGGCSVGTHNTSKGICRDIQVCEGGQCATETDHMTQNNCEMVGGSFEPVNHKSGWFNF